MSNQQLFGMTPSELDEIYTDILLVVLHTLVEFWPYMFYGFVVMAQLVVT